MCVLRKFKPTPSEIFVFFFSNCIVFVRIVNGLLNTEHDDDRETQSISNNLGSVETFLLTIMDCCSFRSNSLHVCVFEGYLVLLQIVFSLLNSIYHNNVKDCLAGAQSC